MANLVGLYKTSRGFYHTLIKGYKITYKFYMEITIEQLRHIYIAYILPLMLYKVNMYFSSSQHKNKFHYKIVYLKLERF